MTDFDSSLLERYDEAHPHEHNTIGPSEVGRCLRQIGYEQSGTPKTDERSRNQARLGQLMHLGYGVIVSDAGRASEISIRLPGLRSGTADDIDFDRQIVNDLKTANDRSYVRWVTGGLPEKFWDQVELYAYGLWLARETANNGGWDEAYPLPNDWTLSITLLNRETGEEQVFMRPADPEHGKQVLVRLLDRQRQIDDAFSPNELPREGSGPGRGFPCDYCDWVSACWPDPDDEELSPQSATIADDPILIGQVLEDYLAVSAELSKLDKAKKDARAFLTGIPAGDYGDATLKWQGGNELDPEPDVEEMMAILDQQGIAIPVKPKFSAKSLRVVRKKPKATVSDVPDPESAGSGTSGLSAGS